MDNRGLQILFSYGLFVSRRQKHQGILKADYEAT